MVDQGPEVLGVEEVDTIEVGDIDPPGVRGLAV